jgi:16S rRNA (guanine527-N7)-methyltransferase
MAFPVEPVGAVRALFGDREDLARRFHGHLSTTAVSRGLIGPREAPRLWERHILNCAAVAELIPARSSAVDVGSGAGLPGIVLAIALPETRLVLVEPLLRRVAWLEEVVGDLGLLNVTIVRARAEELWSHVEAEVVTARAVATLPVLARLCLPLVRPGGRFLAVKGRTAREELEMVAPELSRLGGVAWEVRRCGEGVLSEPTTVVEVTAGRGVRGGGGGQACKPRRVIGRRR